MFQRDSAPTELLFGRVCRRSHQIHSLY